MDHSGIYIRSAIPNQAPVQFLPVVGVPLGNEKSSSGLMSIDGKTFSKTVGQELLAANYDVKGHAGQKRSTSKKAQTNKSASATRKTAARKTSKPRKNSAKKPSKPKKSAGTRKTSTSKARKNSADKKKPKPKKPSKEKAGAEAQQQS